MKRIILFLFAAIAFSVFYLLFSASPQIKNTNPIGDNIICFGDSLTYGTGAGPGMNYPSQLSQMINKDVINAGIPGDTTQSALNRLDKDVLSKSPRIVLVTLGGNDLKNRANKEEAFHRLKTIIESIQARGALVIVGGIDLPFFGKGYGQSYKRVCNETGAVLIPNIYKGILGKEELMSDPIHPNSTGYTIMARHFYKAIKPYL